MKKYLSLILMIGVLVINSLIPLSVFAVNTNFYSSNNILFYNPDDTVCSPGSALAAGTTTTSLTKSPTLEKIFTYLISTPITSNNNKPLNAVQASAAMGNMYVESQLNPSSIEVTTRVDKGHGIAQWTFGRWTNLQAFAAQKGTAWDNLDTQLAFLSNEFNNSYKSLFTDTVFSTTTSPGDAAIRYRIIFEGANPLLAHDQKRIDNSITIYGFYKDLAPSMNVTNVAAGCASTTGVVAGDIVNTALGFALQTPATDSMNKQSDARDTYQAAKTKYNPSVQWTDCGGFVATVMIASGVDPNYVKVNTDAQLNYVKSNPQKYEINLSPKITDLKPGDIMFISGHTMIYTGQSQYPAVDASLGQRVPSVRTIGSVTWMLSNGAVTARVIK